ncbi:hypothetical protein ACU4HD_43855 [Cupriavidus basilensis]
MPSSVLLPTPDGARDAQPLADAHREHGVDGTHAGGERRVDAAAR